MHTVLPLLITTVDRQYPQEQMVNIEFLVTIISSALTAALHLEWALHLVTGQTHVRGQGSAVMLSVLARQLRGKKHSPTSKALAQRLCTSTSFMVNFPSFRSDLERS
jgi:mediator of RNA polymerase II transcription subunit 5